MDSAAPDTEPAAPLSHGVAAFDLDGTLTEGGSVFSFLVHLRGAPAVTAATARMAPLLAHAALVGGEAADRTKEALFVKLLAGIPADEAAGRSAAFAEVHLRRRLRSDTAERLRRHQDLGHRTVLVSASPELYVREIAVRLGIDDVVATRLAVDASGRLTGRYEGANCRGQEKAARLRVWLADQRGERPAAGEALSARAVGAPSTGTGGTGGTTGTGGTGGTSVRIWAYGNSRGDRQLLTMADVGVNVGKLGRLGRLRNHPRLAETDDPGAV